MVETNVLYPGDLLLEQELQPDENISSLLSFIVERQESGEILRIVIYRQMTLESEHKLEPKYKEEELSDEEEPDPHLPPSDEDYIPQISKTSKDPKIIKFQLSETKLAKKAKRKERKERKEMKEKKDPNVKIMCEECGKNVGAKYLKFHQRRCGVKKPEPDYFCPHENCVYQCRAKSTLENHINVIHLGKESRYKCVSHFCDICGKGYPRKHQLECHISQDHLKTQDKICNVCGKGFNTTARLNSHKEIHSEPKYPCPACGNLFKQRATLTKHKHYCKAFQVHVSEDANHFCPHCSKGFKTEAHVRLHIDMRCLRKDKK